MYCTCGAHLRAPARDDRAAQPGGKRSEYHYHYYYYHYYYYYRYYYYYYRYYYYYHYYYYYYTYHTYRLMLLYLLLDNITLFINYQLLVNMIFII